jgi:hypothetical protein
MKEEEPELHNLDALCIYEERPLRMAFFYSISWKNLISFRMDFLDLGLILGVLEREKMVEASFPISAAKSLSRLLNKML